MYFSVYFRTRSDCISIQHKVFGFCDKNIVFTARFKISMFVKFKPDMLCKEHTRG